MPKLWKLPTTQTDPLLPSIEKSIVTSWRFSKPEKLTTDKCKLLLQSFSCNINMIISYQHRENQSAELLISDALKLIQESLFVTNDRKQDRMDN